MGREHGTHVETAVVITARGISVTLGLDQLFMADRAAALVAGGGAVEPGPTNERRKITPAVQW